MWLGQVTDMQTGRRKYSIRQYLDLVTMLHKCFIFILMFYIPPCFFCTNLISSRVWYITLFKTYYIQNIRFHFHVPVILIWESTRLNCFNGPLIKFDSFPDRIGHNFGQDETKNHTTNSILSNHYWNSYFMTRLSSTPCSWGSFLNLTPTTHRIN